MTVRIVIPHSSSLDWICWWKSSSSWNYICNWHDRSYSLKFLRRAFLKRITMQVVLC